MVNSHDTMQILTGIIGVQQIVNAVPLSVMSRSLVRVDGMGVKHVLCKCLGWLLDATAG